MSLGTSHSFGLRAKGDLETKVFIVTLSTFQLVRLDDCILYSPCKQQAKRKPSKLMIRCVCQARFEATTKPALYMYSSSSQIHETQAQLHTPRVKGDQNLQPFAQTTCLCFRSQQLCSFVHRSTTWQLVVLMPRSTVPGPMLRSLWHFLAL